VAAVAVSVAAAAVLAGTAPLFATRAAASFLLAGLLCGSLLLLAAVSGCRARGVWHVFLRSFAIQGSWNYRTLQGSGFAFALMPVLRYVHGDE
jgi:hypothetical protein